MTAVVTAVCFVVYYLGYALYSRYLARRVFSLDDSWADVPLFTAKPGGCAECGVFASLAVPPHNSRPTCDVQTEETRMADLKAKFEAAVAASKTLPERPDNATLLKLYALYKQASHGDVRGNKPAEDIVAAARIHQAELIVIGIRQRSATGPLLLGSNALDILHDTTVPVLCVKAGRT